MERPIPTKKIERFVIRVHFRDELQPRYAWHNRSTGMVGTGGISMKNSFPYPLSAREVENCADLLTEAESAWGRDAKVEQVLVDMTDYYVEQLFDARLYVEKLQDMLGVK